MLLECFGPFNRYFAGLSSGSVLRSEILLSAHLLQPREGSIELETQSRTTVQRLRRHFRRGDQFDVAIIELVNQIDKSTRGVLLITAQ